MNYLSVVLRIIFLTCIKNYFLVGLRIIFRGIANLFFGLQCIAGLAFEVDWFEFLTSLDDHCFFFSWYLCDTTSYIVYVSSFSRS